MGENKSFRGSLPVRVLHSIAVTPPWELHCATCSWAQRPELIPAALGVQTGAQGTSFGVLARH